MENNIAGCWFHQAKTNMNMHRKAQTMQMLYTCMRCLWQVQPKQTPCYAVWLVCKMHARINRAMCRVLCFLCMRGNSQIVDLCVPVRICLLAFVDAAASGPAGTGARVRFCWQPAVATAATGGPTCLALGEGCPARRLAVPFHACSLAY